MLPEIRKLNKVVDRVNALADDMRNLSDAGLQHKTVEFKTRITKGESPAHLLPEAFATIREASYRILGLYAFDVQVLGAVALQMGQIAEMKAGEGKTLVAMMPLYLNALTGKSTILATSNPYLACRDAGNVGPVFQWMGLSVGIGVSEDGKTTFKADEKRAIYASDIVYTTHRTLAFDYLIENLVMDKNERYLRDYHYVLIDEADAVLLDDARTPLVLYGTPRVRSNLFKTADSFVGTLKKEDYTVAGKKVWLTEAGRKKAEKFYAIDHLYQERYSELTRHIILALRAHVLFKRGEQYVVEDDKVKLLDNTTGRLLENHELPSGQHQALEAKEGVKISLENRVTASITYPAFFKMFSKVAGMSGAIYDDAKEVNELYRLKVVQIPTNRPNRREDLKDSIYTTTRAQITEAMNWLQKCHARGQPVLVVTSTVEISSIFSDILVRAGILHRIADTCDPAKEAEIIRKAGRQGAVTIAAAGTGRGTDICLEEGAEQAGGLVVLGVGKMASARYEWQARRKAGMQGNRGMSKFFISLEDKIIWESGSKFLEKYREKEGETTSLSVRRALKRIRKQCENQARAARKQTAACDLSMREQRERIYAFRKSLIEGKDIEKAVLLKMIQNWIHTFLAEQKRLHINTLNRFVLNNINYNFNGFARDTVHKSKQTIEIQMMDIVNKEIQKKEQCLKREEDRQRLYRLALLQALDMCWMEQVDYVHQLHMGIDGYQPTQRNTMNEYHKEVHRSFQKMTDMFHRESVRNLLLGTVYYNDKGILQLLLP